MVTGEVQELDQVEQQLPDPPIVAVDQFGVPEVWQHHLVLRPLPGRLRVVRIEVGEHEVSAVLPLRADLVGHRGPQHQLCEPVQEQGAAAVIQLRQPASVDLPQCPVQQDGVLHHGVQFRGDLDSADPGEQAARNRLGGEERADLQKLVRGGIPGCESVEGDVPRGRHGDLVVRRLRRRREELGRLLVQQPRVLGDRHAGLGPPCRGLGECDRQVAQLRRERAGCPRRQPWHPCAAGARCSPHGRTGRPRSIPPGRHRKRCPVR